MSKFVDFCCVELAVAYPEKKTYQKTTVPEGKSVAIALWKRAVNTKSHS